MSQQHRVARQVRVHGRVQGVSFREGCRREALAREVAGWVRNEVDGSVAAHFEGPAAAVEEMVAWCRSGPSLAHVDHVHVEDVSPSGASSFDVRG